MNLWNYSLAASTTIALVIFIQGFLPQKQRITGYGKKSCCTASRFSKTVLIIVDALRTDFITTRHDSWPYLQQLVDLGQARMYHARVHPPTVTLPRIKALISGDIPGFIDVLMNFDSSELKEDNLLYQMKSAGRTSIFYGDDTWLRLFPHTFIRSEGTTSFFVSDYTEVDDNVTRHIAGEMERDDWSFMVLHYLGLDHIGHLVGPSSSLIPLKLSEMDATVRLIHSAFIEKGMNDYLIILCGDHGMADQGGHGGVTPNEVLTPMVFITNTTTPTSDGLKEIFQIDLVPTLAILLNLPIPKNSLGVAPVSILEPFIGSSMLLDALELNSHQLYSILQGSSADSSLGQIMTAFDMQKLNHEAYKVMASDRLREEKLIFGYQKLLRQMQHHLASHLMDYDVSAMTFGLCCFLLVFCLVLAEQPSWNSASALIAMGGGLLTASFHYAYCTSQSPSLVLCSGYLGTLTTLSCTFTACCYFFSFRQLPSRLSSWLVGSNNSQLFVLLLALMHSVSLLSSSFIEEEHQMAYYYTVSLLLLELAYCHRNSKKCCLLLLVLLCLTLARKWNQTGDKWAHLLDIADKLNTPAYGSIKVILAMSALLVIISTTLSDASFPFFLRGLFLVSMAATAVYAFGEFEYFTLSYRGRYEALTVYLCSAVMLVNSGYHWYRQCPLTSLHSLRAAWVLLTTVLHRTVNLPLVALVSVSEYLLSRAQLDDFMRTHLYFWLGQASFFYQGNSNSISTVDISSGYKGLTSYNPILTAFFMLCNTYAGPIFWMLSLYIQIKKKPSNRGSALVAARFFLVFKLMDMIVLQVLIILERFHLFVWTVFAPKLVYEVLGLSLYQFSYLICSMFSR
ncbi:GPI ethanolamine phosphate transferase 2-like [Watersipora subatra]|uniref:GPI ethanolamine phosphate transferase 2-like n=1 Tax=Watersipora subatra TaxID=2589382 RepID=UPI00355C4FE8